MIAAAVCKDPKIGSTEFEEPKDLRETKGTQVNLEKCCFLEFRIKSIRIRGTSEISLALCGIRGTNNNLEFTKVPLKSSGSSNSAPKKKRYNC